VVILQATSETAVVQRRLWKVRIGVSAKLSGIHPAV